MTNFFTRTETLQTEDDFQIIYVKLKSMPIYTIKRSIENNFKIYGEIFLDSMTTNYVLDIDRESNDINLRRRIEQIERTCSRIYKREDLYTTVARTLKSVPAKLVTVSAIGCFVIEIIRLILDVFCN